MWCEQFETIPQLVDNYERYSLRRKKVDRWPGFTAHKKRDPALGVHGKMTVVFRQIKSRDFA